MEVREEVKVNARKGILYQCFPKRTECVCFVFAIVLLATFLLCVVLWWFMAQRLVGEGHCQKGI